MSVGSIIGLNPGETDPLKINAAVRQLLERNGGKQINASIATTGPTYTALASDFMIEVSGNTVVTLPSASAAPGQIYCVKKMDAAGTTTTIDNSIDGSTSATLTTSYQSLLIQSNATRWDALIRSSTAVDVSPFLRTANALSELSTNAAAARTNIGAAGTSQTDFISGVIKAPANQDYRIIERIPYATTLTSFTAKTTAGTVTAALKINASAVTGGSVNATTTAASVSPSSSNVMAAGDALVMTTSSVSTASDLSFTAVFTRTLA